MSTTCRWTGQPENPCSSRACPVGEDCTDSCLDRAVAFVEAGIGDDS